MHSTSFAFRGPTRPLPREPRFDYGPDNLDSDSDFEHQENESEDEEQHPFGRNLQLNLKISYLHIKNLTIPIVNFRPKNFLKHETE